MIYDCTEIAETPSTIGTITSTGTRILAGSAGHGSFGPYGTLEAGRWFAGFHIRVLEEPIGVKAIKIDLICDPGEDVLGEVWLGPDDFCDGISALYGVEFELDRSVTDYELRLYFDGRGKFEVVDKLVFRTDLV